MNNNNKLEESDERLSRGEFEPGMFPDTQTHVVVCLYTGEILGVPGVKMIDRWISESHPYDKNGGMLAIDLHHVYPQYPSHHFNSVKLDDKMLKELDSVSSVADRLRLVKLRKWTLDYSAYLVPAMINLEMKGPVRALDKKIYPKDIGLE